MAERLFVRYTAAGRHIVERGSDRELERAAEPSARYPSLERRLVDATVIAIAERFRARAIATLDVRNFAAVGINGSPRLIPRDL